MQDERQTIQQDTIDLRELFDVLKRRRKLIWSVTAALTLLALVYAFVIAKPLYQTSTLLQLAQINKNPVEDIHNVKQKLENIFKVDIKGKEIEFPIVKSITLPKKTSGILSIITQGYDKPSAEEKINEVIAYIKKDQQKYLDQFKKEQLHKLNLIQENLKQYGKLLITTSSILENYQSKLLKISKNDAALAGIYAIEIGKKQDQLKSLNDQVFHLQNKVINIDSTLSSINLKSTKMIGSIDTLDYAVKPKKKLIILVAFITGLMFSVFLAFFLEYLRGKKEEDAS